MMLMKLARTVLLVFTCFCFATPAQNRTDVQCGLPQSIKVDEFESLSLESDIAKLEQIIPVMEANKNSHGFIVTYGSRRSSLAEAQRRADRAKQKLLDKHAWINRSDVLNSRLNTLVCGYRRTPAMELWVTPVGAAPPVCASTVVAPETRPRARPRRRP